ncbi:MAG: hypothetical protein ABI666_03645 [Ferruginibacter sp.]
MKSLFYFLIAASILICSCTEQNSNNKVSLKTFNRTWLDSIIKLSDSSYIKPYKRSDFVTAIFYINNKDSSICQVMKDSAGIIRQIIIAKKDIRTFLGQYYTNGQLQAELPLDEFGQYHGAAIFYYENGNIKSSGDYVHGLKTGQWKIFNEKGKLVSTDTYNKNGQPVK